MPAPAKAVRDLLPDLIPLLPERAPGISVAGAHEALGYKVGSDTVKSALCILEREGIAISDRTRCNDTHIFAWHYRKAPPADDFELSDNVYNVGE